MRIMITMNNLSDQGATAKLKTDWDLSNLYPSFESVKFKNDMKRAKESVEEALEWTEKAFSDTSDAELKLVKLIEIAEEQAALEWRLFAFTSLTVATDATNETALSITDRLEQISMNRELLIAKSVRFIGSIENLQEIIDSNEKLKEFDYYLNEAYKEAKHLLPDAVEEAVAKLKLTGGNAWSRMRDMLDGTMTVEIEIDGEIQSLPLPVIRNMAYDKDHDVRKKAYEAELESYKKIEMPLAHSLNAIKGENIQMVQMRGYKSVLDWTLEQSRMNSQILDAMLSAIEDSLPAFRKYLRAKAKYLGYENGLPFYELFAPIDGVGDMKYTYEEAHEFLIETFKNFSEEMSEFVDYAIRHQWIDVLPKQGKRGGAFCANLPFIGESRILSNFDGSLSSIGTLAHELGHAWHGHCLKDLSLLKTSYPMPLAETASIFNEGLVTEALLKKADDKAKLALLEAELMDATQVIVDIYSRFLFESKVVETRHDHSMSVKEMKDAMLDAQKKAYGDGLDQETLHPYMWACKPHYYYADMAFYNWPYSFGQLFANCIFQEYRKQPEGFVERYKKLLTATGSNDVADVAKMMDVDLTKKQTWTDALKGIIEKVDSFCELVK